MNPVVVLAMHGVPPRDFPKEESAEFFSLRASLERAAGQTLTSLERRFAELDDMMRGWPRHESNDPLYVASMELAHRLSAETGMRVLVGFNEFCGPSLEVTLEHAAVAARSSGACRVIVVTPMMTRGGEHAEADIPEAIEAARRKHPDIRFSFVWPFDVGETVRFLAGQIVRSMAEG
jgi:sirohydrochlorin cobaltochelatase